MSNEMGETYFTFGVSQPFADYHVRITDKSRQIEPRKVMCRWFGTGWGFQHSGDDGVYSSLAGTRCLLHILVDEYGGTEYRVLPDKSE